MIYHIPAETLGNLLLIISLQCEGRTTFDSCRYSKWVAKLNWSESWSVAYAVMSNSALCMFQSLCTIACAIEIAIESDE